MLSSLTVSGLPGRPLTDKQKWSLGGKHALLSRDVLGSQASPWDMGPTS